VVVKADLQTVSKRYVLHNLESDPIKTLAPDQSQDNVLHQVKLLARLFLSVFLYLVCRCYEGRVCTFLCALPPI
jgi:hypothetical protein